MRESEKAKRTSFPGPGAYGYLAKVGIEGTKLTMSPKTKCPDILPSISPGPAAYSPTDSPKSEKGGFT